MVLACGQPRHHLTSDSEIGMQNSQPARDRRSAPRAPLSAKVQILHGEIEFSGYAIDLSAHGVFVETQHSVEPGDTVRMAFSVGSDRTSVDVEGRVVRRIDADEARSQGSVSGLGIEFDRFRTGHNALLQELARRLGTLADGAAEKANPPSGRRGTVAVLWGTRPPPNCKGQVVHVSSSGAFIATPEPPPPGTHLYLQVERRGSLNPEPFKAFARVVRANLVDSPAGDEPQGMGIVFEAGTAEDELVRFLAHQITRPPPEAKLPTRRPGEPAEGGEASAPASDFLTEPMIAEFEDDGDDEDDSNDPATERWKRPMRPEPATNGASGRAEEARSDRAARPAQKAGAKPGRPPLASAGTKKPFDWGGTIGTLVKFLLLPLLAFLIAKALSR
jgi:Tfp pilus assembly protein PilZ